MESKIAQIPQEPSPGVTGCVDDRLKPRKLSLSSCEVAGRFNVVVDVAVAELTDAVVAVAVIDEVVVEACIVNTAAVAAVTATARDLRLKESSVTSRLRCRSASPSMVIFMSF